MRPEVPPKRITSTSTSPTSRAPPAAAVEIHARRPGLTGSSSGATCPGQGAPSTCARCCERPSHPRGNILSFPGRGALPRDERELLLARILLLFPTDQNRPVRAGPVTPTRDA